jgi:hypothetical protein
VLVQGKLARTRKLQWLSQGSQTSIPLTRARRRHDIGQSQHRPNLVLFRTPLLATYGNTF